MKNILTIDDFIEDVYTKTDADFRRALVESKDPIEFHFSFGMWIRNTYGLWEDGSPLVKETGEEHPDDASYVMICRYRDWLKTRQLTHGDCY